jgi:AcrR family transcriptional regulator
MPYAVLRTVYAENPGMSTPDERRGAQLPSHLAAAWGLRTPAGRGPRPGLSVERIVAAGIAIADDEGLAAVSMARVAKALGAAPMALYRHVDAKEDLVALMVDAAYGPAPEHVAGEDWRAGLTRWAWSFLRAAEAHPWGVQVPIRGLPLAPNEVAWFEHALAAQASTGLAEGERASVVLLLSGYVRNHMLLMSQLGANLAAAAPTPDAAMAGATGQLRALIDPQRFPALTALLDSGVLDRADPPDEEFAFGLERLLDGVAALVEQRRRS